MQDRESPLVELAPGIAVERDVLGIVEKIYEYDPNLKLQYIPPGQATLQEAPYRIVETGKDGKEYVVMTAWELDDRILQRLYEADTHKHNILLGLDGKNLIAKKNEERRFKEKMGEAHDIFKHAWNTRKSKYTVKDGDRVIEV